MKLIHADCLEQMKSMPDNSVDAIVTDPPYGISFMGKKWDYDVPSVEIWKECLRVLKPGGFLLAFAGTRTQHRMCINIEDAGFEIRDMIAWIYGSGFPKSLNVGKAIDKAAGAKREVVGEYQSPEGTSGTSPRKQEVYSDGLGGLSNITAPATPEAKQWEGWGTALKPALEPITVARKPLGEKTVAANVLKWGTGGININGCRVGTESTKRTQHPQQNGGSMSKGVWKGGETGSDLGRFPANLIHDGSEEVLEGFPETTKQGSKKRSKSSAVNSPFSYIAGNHAEDQAFYGDKGSAARFFYCAKASKKDRNEEQKIQGRFPANLIHDGSEEVLEGFPETHGHGSRRHGGSKASFFGSGDTKGVNQNGGDSGSAARFFYCAKASKKDRGEGNKHPTVKPTKLMQYLVRLVTPPGGTVLDPFMGSGSTGKACVMEGFDFIGIELEEEYFEIAKARIENTPKPLF